MVVQSGSEFAEERSIYSYKTIRAETLERFRYLYKCPQGIPPSEHSGAIIGPPLCSKGRRGVPASDRGLGAGWAELLAT